jgi:two-component system cell cycle response regulator
MLDPLTGLHNRRYAQGRLAAEIARAQRYRDSLTVLMLDLDNFKWINDRYGHSAGDVALTIFSERLGAAIRGSDLAVRIGGDEFEVLLPKCTPGQVEAILNRLSPLEIQLDGEKVSLAFSAGWTEYQEGETPEQLLQRADQALYAQKQIRRGQNAGQHAKTAIPAASEVPHS